jgi:ubiquitin-conjugating enzyme E2 M
VTIKGFYLACNLSTFDSLLAVPCSTDLSEVDMGDTGTLSFPDPNDLTQFCLSIAPTSGHWEGGSFDFVFNVLPSYPHSPPKIRCTTKIYHPNIAYDGKVCTGLRDVWRPVHDINTVIHALILLFYHPDKNNPVNQQAADLLGENEVQFQQVVDWTRRRTNDKKIKDEPLGHCLLDALPPEMVRNTIDFLDEESVVKFMIASLGSVMHQFIYASVARNMISDRFDALKLTVANPPATIDNGEGTLIAPTIPQEVVRFVTEYATVLKNEQVDDRIPRDATMLEDGELPDTVPRLVDIIRTISGRLAVLKTSNHRSMQCLNFCNASLLRSLCR